MDGIKSLEICETYNTFRIHPWGLVYVNKMQNNLLVTSWKKRKLLEYIIYTRELRKTLTNRAVDNVNKIYISIFTTWKF